MRIIFLKKFFLFFIIFFVFFIFCRGYASAVECTITPKTGYKDITMFIIECSGLEPDKNYAFDVYRRDVNAGHNFPSTPACGRSNSQGKLSVDIGPYHEAGNWFADLKDRSFTLGCHSKPSTFYSQVAFDIHAAPTYQQTTCQAPGDASGQKTGVITALGCIPTKPQELVKWILKNAIGLGGGIGFLLIIFGIFNIITSSGNPEKLNKGKEIIVSAITGLLMIIFSVVLLKIIGVDILAIPGFGK